MKIVAGNLVTLALAGNYDLIMQGCNCMNQMGRGIALTIKNTWPEVYQADLATVKGDKTKLGTYTKAVVDINGKPLVVVNCYTQYNYNYEGVLVDYTAVQQVMTKIKQDYSGLKMAMPLIGAGLAKGDWSILSPIIETALEGEDLTLVVLPQ